VSGKAKPGLQKRHTPPARIHDSNRVGAGGFDPAQSFGASMPVVTGKVKKPRPQQDDRTERVNKHQASHKASNCEYYD
jgi:hypothetical protein